MQLNPYRLTFDSDKEVFEFISDGPNGTIQKLVLFQLIETGSSLYNLAFGDKSILTGEIDDRVVTNNGDTDKVLATVVKAADYFFESHPYALLYAKGSSKSRTRLYQIGINKNLLIAQERYIILGKVYDNWEPFKKGIIYEAFLIRKKK